MPPPLSRSISTGWLNLDAWSEGYVGAHWLVESELPQRQWETLPRHGPLSQMVLLASHHLVEVMLFRCIWTLLDANRGKFVKQELRYHRAMFHEAFYEWPTELLGHGFDLSVEPFKSAARLHTRRNATVHKESALTTLPMARSALFTAVETSRAIATEFLGVGGFKYEAVLQKYPMAQADWFSVAQFPERSRI